MPEPPTETKTAAPKDVIAAYRRLHGFDDDLNAHLQSEPLTPLVTVAGLADFFFPIFLTVNLHTWMERAGYAVDYGSSTDLVLVLAGCAGLGFLIANSGDDYRFSSFRRIGKPLGIFTGLILRGRMRMRRAARIAGPVRADDPRILGPVAREWGRAPIERAELALGPDGWMLVEDGGLSRLTVPPELQGTVDSAAERVQTTRADLRAALDRTRSLLADPSLSADPLREIPQALAELRRTTELAEIAAGDGETIRANLRRGYGFAPGALGLPGALGQDSLPSGSLEGPIVLNRKP